MQRNTSIILTTLAVAIVMGAPLIQAQSRLIADVPFAFNIGDRTMAAGHYEYVSVSEQVAQIRNLNSDVSQLLIKAQNVQARRMPGAMLVFNRYGEEYFLSQIWDGSSDIGIQLARSKREKEISLAEKADPQLVILAMK
jgi:hypothetical protein